MRSLPVPFVFKEDLECSMHAKYNSGKIGNQKRNETVSNDNRNKQRTTQGQRPAEPQKAGKFYP